MPGQSSHREPDPAQRLHAGVEAAIERDEPAELRELVKENPDTAANILRAWIGDAA